jgi:hypothetical protein
MAKSKRTSKPAGKIARRNEDVRVGETDEALPLKPEPRTQPGPTQPAAIDRRKQVVGTDEAPRKSRR